LLSQLCLSRLIAKANIYILDCVVFVALMLTLCLVMAIIDSSMNLGISTLYFLASATTTRDSVNKKQR